MASLVDSQLLQAYRQAMQPSQDATTNLIRSVGGLVGGGGAAAVGQALDVRDKKREIEAMERALAGELSQLETERKATNVEGPLSPYAGADRAANLQNIDRRISQVRGTKDQLSQVGEPSFFDKGGALPQLAERQDTAPNYRDIDYSIGEDRYKRKSEADRKAKDLAQSNFNRSLLVQESKIAQMLADKDEKAALKKAILPPKMVNKIDAADAALDSLAAAKVTFETYKHLIPKTTQSSVQAAEHRRKGTLLGDAAAFKEELFAKNAPTEEEREGVSAIMAAMQTVSGPKIKELYGAVLTPTELAKANLNSLTPGDSLAEIVRKSNELIKLAELGRQREIEKARAMGLDPTAYEREPIGYLDLSGNGGDQQGNIGAGTGMPSYATSEGPWKTKR